MQRIKLCIAFFITWSSVSSQALFTRNYIDVENQLYNVVIMDDFMTTTGDKSNKGSDGNAAHLAVGFTHHPLLEMAKTLGAYSLSTGSSDGSNGSGSLWWPTRCLTFDTVAWTFRTKIKTGDNPTTANQTYGWVVGVGFTFEPITNNGGAFFMWRNSTDSLLIKNSNGVTDSVYKSPHKLSTNTWYRLRIDYLPTPTPRIKYYLNDALVYTSTLILPNTTEVQPGAKNRNIANTALVTKYLTIDYFYLEYKFNRRW